MVCDPEHAARLGADAAVMCLVEGYADADNYALNVRGVAEAARRCADAGLPLIVESVLWGSSSPDQKAATRRAAISPIAAELGADAITTQDHGRAEGMRAIVEACPAPVMVLGGAAADAAAVERFTQGAIAGAAVGVISPRNVWPRGHVAGMPATRKRLVHGG